MYAFGITILDTDDAQDVRAKIRELEAKCELLDVTEKSLDSASPTNHTIGQKYRLAESVDEYECWFYLLFHPSIAKADLLTILGDSPDNAVPLENCKRKYLGKKFATWGRAEMEAALKRWMADDGIEKSYIVTASTLVPTKILPSFETTEVSRG